MILVLALFLTGGCGGKQQPTAGAEGGRGDAVPVKTAKTKMGTLEAANVVSGKLEAGQSANVVAKVPGKVAAVHVDVGSAVHAGQVLVTLENTDLAARLEQAKAGVKQAEATLAQAQANLKSAQANLENSRENYRIAEASYNRAKELLVAGAIPQAEFESRYELPYKQARQAAEVIGPAQVELAQAQLSSAQAALENAQAQLTLAKTAYDDSLIRAPISGLVTARNVNPGEMASSTAPVISLANLDKVEVRATVGESLVNQLKQGQKVQVKISAVSDKPFTGVVTSIAPAADPVSKGFPVKIQIDNPKHLLKPGMFAEVQLGPPPGEALLVPREAVIKAEDKNVVWVVKDGQAQKKEVQVGESDGQWIIVTAGLTEGEEVVVAGQENLQEGVMVNVRNQEGK
ncbi:MAG: efflux RND transporter periplasmic adaptor subunit [Armatimonadetes bacterium]|nr:efflux RND transporter periplasmic adaptor subunit [Armatimonadota bacterium]